MTQYFPTAKKNKNSSNRKSYIFKHNYILKNNSTQNQLLSHVKFATNYKLIDTQNIKQIC